MVNKDRLLRCGSLDVLQNEFVALSTDEANILAFGTSKAFGSLDGTSELGSLGFEPEHSGVGTTSDLDVGELRGDCTVNVSTR